MPIRSEVQYAAIAAATQGDNTLVAAVADRRIRVHSLVVVATGGANDVALESDADGTALTGDMGLVEDGQLVLPHNPAGWCETVAGELLNLELSGATAVAGMLTYSLIE